MYSEDSKKKVYYFLSDIIALVVGYLILAQFYPYHPSDSKLFAVVFGILIVIAGVLSDEYSSITNCGYLKELKASVIYGMKVLVLFTFALILGKIRFIRDISQVSYFFLEQIFVLVSLFAFIGCTLVKNPFKNHATDIKQILFVTDFMNSEEVIREFNNSNYHIAAYISRHDNPDISQPILKSIKEIRDFVANHRVDEIFVAKSHQDDFIEFVHCLKLLGIPTTVAVGNYPNFYAGDSVLKKVDGTTFITTAFNIVRFRQIALKRLMDIAMVLVGLVITGIIAIIIAPIVKKQSSGSLIFKQKRADKNGRVFEIYKFRSIYTDAEERKKELLAQNDLDIDLMFRMEDNPRILPFGHKLRDWSLDELPQFINVLKGEMSVVGTRPPTLDEYHHCELRHFKRLTTKPGITGLWQASGRNDITDSEEVAALNMKYIQNWGISKDTKTIIKTFGVVLKREGGR